MLTLGNAPVNVKLSRQSLDPTDWPVVSFARDAVFCRAVFSRHYGLLLQMAWRGLSVCLPVTIASLAKRLNRLGYRLGLNASAYNNNNNTNNSGCTWAAWLILPQKRSQTTTSQSFE